MNGPEPVHPQDVAGHEVPDPAFERALRQAVRPVEAPAGFADRVMAQVQPGSLRPRGGPVFKVRHWPRRYWAGIAAATLLLGVLGSGLAVERVRQQQKRVVEATRQFETTERITVHALAQAREQLQRAGVPLSLD